MSDRGRFTKDGVFDLTGYWLRDQISVDLSELPGHTPWRLSDEARREIEANAARSQRVLTTAHLYRFG